MFQNSSRKILKKSKKKSKMEQLNLKPPGNYGLQSNEVRGVNHTIWMRVETLDSDSGIIIINISRARNNGTGLHPNI